MGTVRRKALDRFWRFVDERQMIYQRRFIEGKKRPWTKDPTLNEFQFTNVYRELDRGTLYYTQEIVPACKNPADIVFNTLIYRLFNHIPTYEFLCRNGHGELHPFRLGHWNGKVMAKLLKKWRDKGNHVFTSAFTVTGQRFGGFTDKIDNICWLIDYLQEWLMMRPHWREIWKAKDMETAFRRVRNLLGFGPFLAYEIVIDLNYANGDRWTENKFVNPGPGAKRGINAIWPELHTVPEYVKAIHRLRKMQHERLPLGFPYGAPVPTEMSLRNIEHSLCEFQKYEKRRRGIRTGRARVFTPNTRPLPGERKKG